MNDYNKMQMLQAEHYQDGSTHEKTRDKLKQHIQSLLTLLKREFAKTKIRHITLSKNAAQKTLGDICFLLASVVRELDTKLPGKKF